MRSATGVVHFISTIVRCTYHANHVPMAHSSVTVKRWSRLHPAAYLIRLQPQHLSRANVLLISNLMDGYDAVHGWCNLARYIVTDIFLKKMLLKQVQFH